MRPAGGEMELEFQTEMKSTICPRTKSVHNGSTSRSMCKYLD